MSGKQQNTGRWGGRRENAGRKPKYMMSDYMVKNMLQAARKRARETGKTLDDVLLDIAYNENGEAKVKEQLTAISIFKAHTMSKTSEQHISVQKDDGMRIAVRLPPKKPDPALEVFRGGKK